MGVAPALRRSAVTRDDTIASRLKFLNFVQAHRETLREMRPLVNQLLPGILEDFYAHIGKFPETAGFVTSQEAKGSVKARQLKHWDGILAADFDDTYLKSVERIGETHNRLQLEPRWYIGGYSYIIPRLIAAVEAGFFPRGGEPPGAPDKTR